MNDPLPYAPPPPPQQTPKKKANPLGGILVLIVIGVAVWYLFLRNPGSSPSSGSTPRPPAVAATAAGFPLIRLSGTGDDIANFTIPSSSAAMASLTHSGSSNFAVKSLAADGSTNDLLVNTIGRYTGTVLFDTSIGEHSVAFEVTADGRWDALLQPPTSARAWSRSAVLQGSGDDVVRISPATSGLTPVALTHNGESNFAVFAYSSSGGSDLLVNEIGSYSGTVNLPSGTYLMSFEADGAWTATPR